MAETQQQTTAATAPPDVESIRAAAEARAAENASEIVALCGLAGMPQMAVGYLAARTPRATVLAELRNAQAERNEEDEIRGETASMASASGINPLIAACEALAKEVRR